MRSLVSFLMVFPVSVVLAETTSIEFKDEIYTENFAGSKLLELTGENQALAQQRNLRVWTLVETTEQEQMAGEIFSELLADPEFQLVSEQFDIGSGGIDVRGVPVDIIFRISNQRRVRNETQWTNFGIANLYEKVLNGAHYQKTLVQEVMIPPTKEITKADVVRLIKLVNSTPYFTQGQIVRHNPTTYVAGYEGVTVERFLQGVESIAGYLNEILVRGDIQLPGDSTKSLGGGDYYIYNSGYSPNTNLNTRFDLPFDVAKDVFANNFRLSVILFAKKGILPDSPCEVSSQDEVRLQSRWLQEVIGFIEQYGAHNWSDNPDNRLSCN